jgi:iron complex outermembrane recepter protein
MHRLTQSTKNTLAVTASLVALTMAAPAVAFAQAAASEPARETEVVVVTGSRIATQVNRAISPIRVIDAEDIRATNEVNIDEILKTQNQFAPSNGATTNPTLLESHGASTLDMRGLGQNRTLVLINGQRATPNGFRNSADVNAIPSAMIARVDTLTGGAASVYGADAVAGVTNFILRDSYEGLEVTATGNISEQGDAEAFVVGVTGGKSFFDDRLNVVLHASYADRGGIQRADRDWAKPELNDAGNPIQTFATAGGAFRRWNSATAAPSAASTPTFAYLADGTYGTTVGSQNFNEFEAFWNPNDRTNAALFATFKLSDAAQFYLRATYSLINNTSQQVPVRSDGNPAAQDIIIQRNNPFLTPQITASINAAGGFNLNRTGTAAGTDAVKLRVSKTLLDLGPLIDTTEREQNQVIIGVKGDITPTIRYDLAYVSGQTNEVVQRNGWGSATRYLQATNATTVNGQAACVDPSNGCVPFNVFGPLASSAEARAWIYGDTNELFNKRVRHQYVANLNVSGDTTGLFELPAGPIGWAIGAERREEYGNSAFGPRAAVRDTLHTQGARGVVPLEAEFELTEYYGELRVPLLAEVMFAKSLDLEAAARYSEHSRSGNYDTWKLGLNWAINDHIRIRGSQQTVVRGPNIGEFFGAAVEAPILGTGRPIDYCSDPARYNVPVSLCTALGAPSTPGYIPTTGTAAPLIDGAVAVQGGGDAIKPESGETFTYGFVLTPRFIPGLSIVVDYYNIRIDDAIGTISPIQLMDSCYLVLQDPNSSLCQKITRNAQGRVVKFDQRDTNLTLLETAGWDFSVYYNAKLPAALPGDRVNISYQAGTVDTFVRLLFPADNKFDCAGDFGGGACSDAGTGIRAIPSFRSNLNVAWISGDLTLRGGWRYQGEVDSLIKRIPEPQWRNVAANLNAVQHIDSWNYFDIGFSYRFNDNFRIGGSINNLFDKDPPILGSAQQDANTLPAQYDIVGRRYGLNLVWKL